MSCDDDDGVGASVSINETGSDFGGDVTGNGGSTQQVYTWNNPEFTVDWNMDITATPGSSFNLRIDDTDDRNVLDQTLRVGLGDDSRSGVSLPGARGQWTITVTLTDFNGDGSFSISPGD
ncbi:hypothetical protein GCM10023331_33370 [Algivirga pacifica]|uniref:Uncharacterized protein n=2 Tax=Algivirga pacifica TaxID=1162670 RepID=A0ABP9DHG3_9BACT